MARTNLPGKWSGLEMNFDYYTDMDAVDQYLDEVKAAGITNIRVTLKDYTNTTQVNVTKAMVARVVAKGLHPMWGITAQEAEINSTTWVPLHQAILDAALWAQNNGVWEFLLGNEFELYIDNDTLTYEEVRANIKSTATEVQAIFTNGNISYATDSGGSEFGWGWIEVGKGDLDFICMNLYTNTSGYSDALTNFIGEFGADGCYLSEFGLHSTSLDTYSTNEAKQAARLVEFIDEIEAAEYTRASYFNYVDTNWGCKPTQNAAYRKLWYTALLGDRVPTSSRTASATRTTAGTRTAV